jgi:lipopolysaccharide export system permease protein
MVLRWYLLRQFGKSLLLMLTLIAVVILLFDYLEQARRFSERGFGLSAVLSITLLRLPKLLGQTLPFILLFSAMLTSHRLNRGRELLIARLSGLSLFNLMAGLVIAVGLLGAAKIALLDELITLSFSRYEHLEAKLMNRPINLSRLGENGLWLSQTRLGEGDNSAVGYDIIQAQQLTDRPLSLGQIMILQFDDQDRLIARMNAESAIPTPLNIDGKSDASFKGWRLINVTRYDLTATDAPPTPQKTASLDYASDLTEGEVRQRIESPESLTFWQLPSLIRKLQNTGFSTRVHQLYWQSLLAYPLLLITMLVIGLTVGQHGGPRPQQNLRQVMIGAGIAFGFYGLTQVFQALATSDRIPVMIGAWAPASMMLFAALAFLLHQGE